jgi:hypothetical protein
MKIFAKFSKKLLSILWKLEKLISFFEKEQ